MRDCRFNFALALNKEVLIRCTAFSNTTEVESDNNQILVNMNTLSLAKTGERYTPQANYSTRTRPEIYLLVFPPVKQRFGRACCRNLERAVGGFDADELRRNFDATTGASGGFASEQRPMGGQIGSKKLLRRAQTYMAVDGLRSTHSGDDAKQCRLRQLACALRCRQTEHSE